MSVFTFNFLDFWESSANKQINHEIVNLQKLLLVENYTRLLSISLDFHNQSQIIFLNDDSSSFCKTYYTLNLLESKADFYNHHQYKKSFQS